MKKLLICLAIVFTMVGHCIATEAGSARNVVMTWNDNPQTTQTISWCTDDMAGDNQLEYAALNSINGGSNDAATVSGKVRKLTGAAVYVHTVELKNLMPSTTYFYRIGNLSGRFRTDEAASKEPDKFLLFGDSQSFDYGVWQQTVENAYRRNPDAKFIVNNGDLVDRGDDIDEWERWFSAAAPVLRNIPEMPVVGNHETYRKNRSYGLFCMPKMYTELFSLPQNGPNGLKGQAYSWDYGKMHIAVLDTQFGEEKEFVPDSLERQTEWLKNDLALSNQPWKIVFMHRPLYPNGVTQHSIDRKMTILEPIFRQYGVDVVFGAHQHVLARTAKVYNGQPAADGTVYMTTGRSGTKTYQNMERKPWNVYFLNDREQPVYSVVMVTEKFFNVRSFRQNGEMLDEWTLSK